MVTNLIDQYRELHANVSYSNDIARKAKFMIPFIRLLRPASVIDYGCGQSLLPDMLLSAGVPDVHRYDPAIPAYSARPKRKFDLLVSVDVLEHVPESELAEVLTDMGSLSTHAMLVIDIKPAKTILPNGQNAHVTVRPPSWWRDRLSGYYDYLEPFPFNGKRACFKTWRTPWVYRPLLWAQTRYLGLRWRVRDAYGRNC